MRSLFAALLIIAIACGAGLDFPHPTPQSRQDNLYDFCKDKNTFECAMATYNNVNVITDTYSFISYGTFKTHINPLIHSKVHSFDVMKMIVEEAKNLVEENRKETKYFYNFLASKFYYTPSLQRSIFYLNKKKLYTSYVLDADSVLVKSAIDYMDSSLYGFRNISKKTFSHDVKKKLLDDLDIRR